MDNKVFELFNNRNGYDFDEIKQGLIDDGVYEEDEITDERVWDEISMMEYEDYKWVLELLKEVENASGCRWICNGTLGLWDGNFDAGAISASIEKLMGSITKDCDYIEISRTSKGELLVSATHHDGTNSFEIKLLNNRGYQYYENHKWDCSKRQEEIELIEKLWNDAHYTKLPHIERFM